MQNVPSRNEYWIVAVVCMLAVLVISFFYSERTVPDHTTVAKVKAAPELRSPASLDDSVE